MARLFGTDGVRGLANADITVELALALGEAAARALTSTGCFHDRRPRAIIGRDTRLSGEMLSSALAAGMASAGVDVTDVGILPTPGIAYLASKPEIDLGAIISASHNPMPDNGIKFIAAGGYKLDDAVEDTIEALLREDWQRPTGPDVGEIEIENEFAERDYVEHLTKIFGHSLKGLRIAVDCANGAASEVAPLALREAGADVVVVNASPDGRNINDACGSTHPEQLQAVTVASEADLGVAFDGDADRCLAVDHTGKLVDGDQIMGILATDMKRQGTLAKDTLVLTVMSNLGLLLAMREAGITTVQTGVGDRYVLEKMRAEGYSLGGEQSGHVINAHYATTGDGTLTALMLGSIVAKSGERLDRLASIVSRLPQTLVNVSGVDKARAAEDPVLSEAVAAEEAKLGDHGRILLRPSGTEPLVRVMVEAPTQEAADDIAARLAQVVKDQLSL